MNDIFKRISIAAAGVSAAVAIYTGIIFFFGVNVRPAWAWEIAELNSQQQVLQLKFYNYDKRDLRDQLYDNLREQRAQASESGTAPEYLLKQEIDIKTSIEELDRTIDLLEGTIIDSQRQ